MLKDIAIVGAGQAGFQTAQSLRSLGYIGNLTLIGDENEHPYQRPPLSKAYMLGHASVDTLAYRPAKYYLENNIRLVSGPALAIDRTNRRVLVRDGEAIGYDHLVLATGAHNRALSVPGAELGGVFGLRTLRDADAISARLMTAKHAVVVGAGFIGLEFAAVAASLGVSVTVLEMADRAMARAVSREMSSFIAQEHGRWNVKLKFCQALAKIEGKAGEINCAVTTDGERIQADLLVFGIGVLPNVALAEEAGLDIQNGIKVDAHLLTSDPAISAAGDCASFPGAEGEWIRLESVQNAVDQGVLIAKRLMGRPATYSAVPWFWTDQGHLKLQIAGLSASYDTSIIIGEPEEQTFSVLLFRRGYFIALEAVNRAGDFMAARKLLARQTSLSPFDASRPAFDLKAYEMASR